MKNYLPLILLLFIAWPDSLHAQMITGTWKGRINKQKVEVKIIQYGDSLTGTSYYYESGSRYRRYSIKGYFDATTNEAVWWDDVLLEDSENKGRGAGKMALLSRADFNCPGDGRMILDGKAHADPEGPASGNVHLDKTGSSQFPDDWDYVIDNFLTGTNDPEIILDVARSQQSSTPAPVAAPLATTPPVRKKTESIALPEKPVATVAKNPIPALAAPTIEDKFVARKKVLVKEIPIAGDSVWLRFYDNAEIDGDSISLFLNDRLVFTHIRLTGSAYSIAFAVKDLSASNELIMVAENLGSIPPNTSFMVAEVNGTRHEARLESTEGSSAMIRFIKNNP